MTMRTAWFGALACCALSSFGCAGTPADEHAEARETAPAAIEEGLLARITLSETHFVELWEHRPGELTLVERLHADRDPAGPIANDFDPRSESVSAFYSRLAGRDVSPATLAALHDFEERAVPLEALEATAFEPGPAPEIVRASRDKATAEPPGWDFLNEFSWFSSNFCKINTSNDRCFINLESFNDVQTVNGVRAVLFNQDFDLRATMRINFDPCFNQPFFVFCSKPFQGLEKLDLAPRTVLSTKSWGGKNKYQVFASGRHIGVFVDYF